MYLTALSDGRFCYGTLDSRIEVWNANTKTCELSLFGHYDWVHGIIPLSDGRLASCGADRAIRIWNLTTGVCEQKLMDRSRPQKRFGIDFGFGSRMATTIFSSASSSSAGFGSGFDASLSNTHQPSTSVQVVEESFGEPSAVFGLVELQDGRILSWNKDNDLRIWNLTTGVCERRFHGHPEYHWPIYNVIQLEDGRLLSAANKFSVMVWRHLVK
jgi:WD40 repeat protein